MNLNLEPEKNTNIDNFINEIKQTLQKEIFYSIDRFIENFAVCENQSTGEFINIPKNQISIEAKPGDIIKKNGNKYIVDKEKTLEAKKEIKNLANSLFKRKN